MKKTGKIGIITLMIFILSISTVFATSMGRMSTQIPPDFDNDLWLQFEHKSLNIGESIDIFPRRVPQIIDHWANNDVTRPNFNFELIQGDSITLSTNDGDRSMATAVKDGTSIVSVTYDSMIDAQGNTYGASSSVNTGYVVITVGETGLVSPSVSSNLSELTSYDTLYYTKEQGTYPLTFDVFAEGATVQVTLNSEVLLPNADGTYTARLQNRANIIGVVATDSEGNTQSYYKVLDARLIRIVIENLTHPGFQPMVGNTVQISFEGITMPIYKLGAIYNPCFTTDWGEVYGKTESAHTFYQNDILGDVKGYSTQWDLATTNAIEIQFEEVGTYNFTGGRIKGDVYAENIGDDKITDHVGGTELGGNYPVQAYVYSQLPNFSIEVLSNNGATLVQGIDFGQAAATIYTGTSMTEQEMTALLGGITILPNNATNKQYSYQTSNQEILSFYRGNFSAQTTGTATITATTQDGGKVATATITVIDEPATQDEFALLLKNIEEAKKIKPLTDYETAYNTLQVAIAKAEQAHGQSNATGVQIRKAIQDLEQAVTVYQQVTSFIYTLKAIPMDHEIEITVTFPNISVDDLNQTYGTTISKKTTYQSNHFGKIESLDGQENSSLLKKLVFMVPKDFVGQIKLTDGKIVEEYRAGRPPNFVTGEERYYEGFFPDITFDIEQGVIVPPTTPEPPVNPEPPFNKNVVIHIDKLAIGEGYVLNGETMKIQSGDTAWDVTKRALDHHGIEYKMSFNPSYGSVYVYEIDGVAEFDHGPGSGWMYSVNGVYPEIGADKFIVHDGDVVTWKYTTKLGGDIGGGNPSDVNTGGYQSTIIDNVATIYMNDDYIANSIKTDKEKITFHVVEQKNVDTLKLGFSQKAIQSLKELKKSVELQTQFANIILNPQTIAELSDKALNPMFYLKIYTTNLGEFEISAYNGEEKIQSDVTAKIVWKGNYKKGGWYAINNHRINILGRGNKENYLEYSGKLLQKVVIDSEGIPEYIDINANNWYTESVYFMRANHLMNGMTETEFSPEKLSSRAMIVTILYRMEKEPTVDIQELFSDVRQGDWYAEAVTWATKQEIVHGYTDGTFGSEHPITREELVKILYNYAKPTPTSNQDLTIYKDYFQVSDFAKDAVAWAIEVGIIQGVDGQILPKDYATRAQIATIIERFIKM